MSGFTATVNVTLAVGALAETITVTGASPVVDTQTSRQQHTLTETDLDVLPSGAVGLQTLAYVTPGFAATQSDVGGTRDTWSAQGAYTFFHGKTGTRASFDGFRNQFFIGAADGSGHITDSGTIEEMQLETTGLGAESGSGSTSLNAIPKSGSNVFRGSIDGYFSNAAMHGSNLTDEIRAFGINSAAEVQKIYRIGAQLGGPIMRDKSVVLRRDRPMGLARESAGRVLQQAPGKIRDPRNGDDRLRAGLVSSRRRLRLVPDPCLAGDVAGDGEKQVRVLRRHPEKLPLHHGAVHRRERDRIGARLGLLAVRRGAGHVDRARDQPAVARSRRVVAGGQLGQFRHDWRHARRPIDPRAQHQLPVRRDAEPDGADRPDRAERAALLDDLRDRQPQPEGRDQRRAGLQR